MKNEEFFNFPLSIIIFLKSIVSTLKSMVSALKSIVTKPKSNSSFFVLHSSFP